MPNKTIYLRPSDVAVWEEAKAIFGNRLSEALMQGLREALVRLPACHGCNMKFPVGANFCPCCGARLGKGV